MADILNADAVRASIVGNFESSIWTEGRYELPQDLATAIAAFVSSAETMDEAQDRCHSLAFALGELAYEIESESDLEAAS